MEMWDSVTPSPGQQVSSGQQATSSTGEEVTSSTPTQSPGIDVVSVAQAANSHSSHMEKQEMPAGPSPSPLFHPLTTAPPGTSPFRLSSPGWPPTQVLPSVCSIQ